MPTVRDALVSFGLGVLAGLCVFLFWLSGGPDGLVAVVLVVVVALTVGPARSFAGRVWHRLRYREASR